MHSFLVIFAYMSMILVPCACATFGDVLTMEWWALKFPRRQRMAEPLLVAVRQARLREAQMAEIASLSEAAFTDQPAFPAYAMRVVAARNAWFETLAASDRVATHEKAATRVAARLRALTEAHRLANTLHLQEAAPQAVTATPPDVAHVARIFNPERRKQPRRALPGDPGIVLERWAAPRLATPTVDELHALYALERPAALVPGGQSDEAPSASIAA